MIRYLKNGKDAQGRADDDAQVDIARIPDIGPGGLKIPMVGAAAHAHRSNAGIVLVANAAGIAAVPGMDAVFVDPKALREAAQAGRAPMNY